MRVYGSQVKNGLRAQVHLTLVLQTYSEVIYWSLGVYLGKVYLAAG